MALFELTLVLLFIAVILTGLALRFDIPYPTLLALAGVAVAFLPFGPTVTIDPDLALALFVSPVLVYSAFNTSTRDLVQYAMPIASLAVVAVIATTLIVALVGWAFFGLPIGPAIALGAIVAPPDAVAAATVLEQLRPPRHLRIVLEGESLLNDAPALLIFRLAVVATLGSAPIYGAIPVTLFLTLISVGAGYLLGRLFIWVLLAIRDTASAIVVQFVATFGVWLLAERLALSAIITMVSFALTLGWLVPSLFPARLRVTSLIVWQMVVFVLNSLAFVLMGLQARPILLRLSAESRAEDFRLAAAVLASVIVVR